MWNERARNLSLACVFAGRVGQAELFNVKNPQKGSEVPRANNNTDAHSWTRSQSVLSCPVLSCHLDGSRVCPQSDSAKSNRYERSRKWSYQRDGLKDKSAKCISETKYRRLLVGVGWVRQWGHSVGEGGGWRDLGPDPREKHLLSLNIHQAEHQRNVHNQSIILERPQFSH